MKRNVFKIFAVLMVLVLFVSPASASNVPQNIVTNPPPRTPTELPQEIIDEFRDGMTFEEFLIRNQGPIPNALLKYADVKVTVVVQLETPSLIEYMKQVKSSPMNMSASTQISYVQTLKNAQKPIMSEVEKFGGMVMGQYTKTINGFMARIPANEVNSIRALPGVKEVRRAPQHEISLSNSIPLINADDIWEMSPTGFTGTGITIAVIDTGIDYTHAMFGGSGDPEEYEKNPPHIIEKNNFPTSKVIGGYDFAGTDYNASDDAFAIPVPDPDPLDENGHGTHVASTVAGIDAGFGSGVAPDAFLYALKVFGAAGSTNLVMDAIEWAMDPNGDGNISDHVDVINMSLGSDFGPNDENDPELIVVEAATEAGVFVVASAGNASNSSYIVGAPSVSDSALSVAASSTGFETAPYIVYNDGVEKFMPYTTSGNPFNSAITAEFVDVDAVDGDGSGYLCYTTDVESGVLTGKIALIQRGGSTDTFSCTFDLKINNAQTLGAIAAVIYNNTAGAISMLTEDSTLPAASILQTDGAILKLLANKTITIGPDSNVRLFESEDPVDTIADFSSRGPRGFDSKLKPEITAPGVAIFAANMGSGDQGVSYSGTSMAAPHVAGVAALIKQARPGWTNEQIKAAIMNTAVDLADSESAQVPRQGAGRVDAYAALNTNVVAVGDPKLVSLSWGVIEVTEATYQDVKTVTLYNFTGADKTLDVVTVFTSESDGATLTPSTVQVTIPALGSTTVDVTLELDNTLLPLSFGVMEEYYGYVLFREVLLDEKLVAPTYRVPFYFVPRPYTELTEVEAVTSFDIQAGYGYVDLDQTGPSASNLWAYPVFMVDENEEDILDMGDVRYVGMDYGGFHPTYGDIIVPAFSMWGPIHTNQPYFSEIDLYVDADQDGNPEVENFNFNYGWVSGIDDNNVWVVLQIDYADMMIYLASPFLIYADFNSGFQEWYLPTFLQYIDTVETWFDYYVYSYDWYGMEDEVGMASFDYAKPPLGWIISDFAPVNSPTSFLFGVNDIDGYLYSKPLGVMLVDYHGKPGAGQAYFWEIDPRFISRLPLIFK